MVGICRQALLSVPNHRHKDHPNENHPDDKTVQFPGGSSGISLFASLALEWVALPYLAATIHNHDDDYGPG